MATETTDLQWALQAINSGTVTISFFLSQPTSGCCLQETQNSVRLNITKHALSQFTRLLKILATPEQTSESPSLKNLKFHSVEWDPLHVQHLAALLDNNPIVEHLTFKRNRFDPQCLSELSLTLSKNKSIKQIVLSESSIGSKGAEELSKMIEANSSLELFTIFDSKPTTATPLISAVLARNRSMEVHIWSTNHNKESTKVVEFVPEDYMGRWFCERRACDSHAPHLVIVAPGAPRAAGLCLYDRLKMLPSLPSPPAPTVCKSNSKVLTTFSKKRKASMDNVAQQPPLKKLATDNSMGGNSLAESNNPQKSRSLMSNNVAAAGSSGRREMIGGLDKAWKKDVDDLYGYFGESMLSFVPSSQASLFL